MEITEYSLVDVHLAARGDFGDVDIVITLNEAGEPFSFYAFNGIIYPETTAKKQDDALIDYLNGYMTEHKFRKNAEDRGN